MFGSLRPNHCQLGREDGLAYRRLYCGTCKALGEHHGQLTRPLLSYDAVLLAGVVEALAEAPAATSSCRCPLMPVVYRPILAPDSTAMRVAAAVQVVLADEWLADHAQDGHTSAALARPLFGRRAEKARQELVRLGLDTSAFDALAARQNDIEHGTRDVLAAAMPTAAMLEALFGQLGRLPGAITQIAPDTPHAANLARLGRNLGIAIYALDALEDLADDLGSGSFNPCLDTRGRLSLTQLDEVGAVLEHALAEMGAAVAALPWQRHRSVIDNVLGQRFPARCQKALATARAQAALWVQTPPRRRIWPVRALAAMAAVLAAVWAWAARSVRATRHRHAHRCDMRAAGAEDCNLSTGLVAASSAGAVMLSMAGDPNGSAGGDAAPAEDAMAVQSTETQAQQTQKRSCCERCDCCDCCHCADCYDCCRCAEGCTCSGSESSSCGSCCRCGDGCDCGGCHCGCDGCGCDC